MLSGHPVYPGAALSVSVAASSSCIKFWEYEQKQASNEKYVSRNQNTLFTYPGKSSFVSAAEKI